MCSLCILIPLASANCVYFIPKVFFIMKKLFKRVYTDDVAVEITTIVESPHNYSSVEL
jgi:hypothetical protein